MKLFSLLKRATQILKPYDGCWAVCGGIAASLYRETPRFTGDLDIALIDPPGQKALEVAKELTSALGYKPIMGHVTDQNGRLIKGIALVLGREDVEEKYVGIDFLLPLLPWISPAVLRAQSNKLDYGLAKLPTVTTEDLIVAKLFAYSGNPDRWQDLDDIKSILNNMPQVDTRQITDGVEEYKLSVPMEVEKLL